MTDEDPAPETEGIVTRTLHHIVSQIPGSSEPPAADPLSRAQTIAKSGALRAAALSGTMALPPGPLGLATVIPDLIAVWRMQQQLVADIAAAFGKTAYLTHESMIICLFKHGDTLLTRGLFSRVGQSILIRRVASRTLQQLLAKIAVRMTQRLAAKGLSRWLPLLGAVGVGAHAYYDTSHVAANAIELFSQDVQLESESDEADADEDAEALPSSSKASTPRKSRSGSKPRRVATGTRKARGVKNVTPTEPTNGAEPSVDSPEQS